MKRKLVTLLLVILLSGSAILAFLPVHGEEEIYGSVVRLHVLANSDSEEDQANKLAVRDAVLNFTAPLLEGADSIEEARQIFCDNLEEIRDVAKATLKSLGCSDSVKVVFGEENYPERSYDSLCFPSGSYLSLRILLGNAEGKNWWCCLFPPLCQGAAAVPKQEAEEALLAVGLTPEQYRIITETEQPVYKVRFKILELLQSE